MACSDRVGRLYWGRMLRYEMILLVVGLLPVLLQAAEQPRILVHGHRGARARLPENTLPSFDYAIRQGVDALEMDMAVTRDNVIVISHDPILETPICSGPRNGVAIHSLTLDEVGQWDCGAVQNPKFPAQNTIPGTRMPTLDDVFQIASRGTFNYNIEAKSFPERPEYTPPPEEFSRLVLEKIRQYKLENRVALLSFDFRILVAMRKLAPEIRLSALTDSDPRAFTTIAKEAANAEIVSPHYQLVTPEKVATAHASGIQVVAWTVNEAADWDRMIEAKVDAIVSDDPAALIAHLKKCGLR